MRKLHHLTWSIFLVQLTLVYSDTPPKNYSSYRPFPHCAPSEYMRYPTTVEDVLAIVNEARNRSITVKAIGARHSQTDVICTEHIPVDMTNFKSFTMNPDGVTASFGPGVTLREAGEFLQQHERSLQMTPGFGGITLGGAIGTGAHGSSIKYNGTLSAQVVGMTVVDGRGQIVEISDPDDLNSFKVNLGLLGIVVNITLYTVPLFKVLAHNYIVSDDILTSGKASELAKTSDQITFYWFPALGKVVVANATFVDVSESGNAYSTAFAPPTYGYFNVVGGKAKEVASDFCSSTCSTVAGIGNTISHAFEIAEMSSLVTQIPGFAPMYTEDGTIAINPAVGYAHKMFATFCSEEDAGLDGQACFWAHGDIKANLTSLDTEFCIDINNLAAFSKAVKDVMTKTSLSFPLMGMMIRVSGETGMHMSTSFGRDTAHVEFISWLREDVYNEAGCSLTGYQEIGQILTKTFNGRSHWGKSGSVYHGREMLDLKLNPDARAKFIAAMKKFDPDGVFMNNFGRRILKSGSKIDSDPKVTRCALLDNCFCSKNEDCTDTQTCTTLRGYPDYRVCKTRNELPESDVDESAFPPPSDIFNWLSVDVPNIVAPIICPITGLLTTVPKVIGSILW